jgi:hypothetical protein
MPANDFLDDVGRSSRPAPNVSGDFDCFVCRERIDDAHYDYSTMVLSWWCSEGHESTIKDFNL